MCVCSPNALGRKMKHIVIQHSKYNISTCNKDGVKVGDMDVGLPSR